MTVLMLLFVGSAYLLNGLTGLGKIDPKSSAPLNLFIGTSLFLATIYLAAGITESTIKEPSHAIINVVGYPLFAFTFLYVGVLNYTGHDGAGLGWYCGWSALVSAGLAYAHGMIFGDISSGLLWSVWTVVFTAFFLTMVLGLSHLQRTTGRFVVLAGFTTCVIPAAMMMLGFWNSSAGWFLFLIEFGTIAYFVIGAVVSSLGLGLAKA